MAIQKSAKIDPPAFADELRAKHPIAAERAKTSRATAVKLFCIECCGGSRKDAVDCAVTRCFLWPYRPKRTVAPAVGVALGA